MGLPRTQTRGWLLVFQCLLVSSFFSFHAFAEERGKALFNLCMSCHGADGRGNQELGAPGIAGLPEWYILAQLEKFQAGYRGKHPNDDAGNRMRPMARTLRGNDNKYVAAYVAALPRGNPNATVGGNAEKGKTYYAVCMACHGPTGDGNEAVHAPPLKYSGDWYLVHQLMNFKNKIRGADPAKDPMGGVMAPQAAALPDEEAVKDVVTYIQSLK